MNINWKVRIKNPIFWAEVAVSVFAPILAYLGWSFSDLTTWGKLGTLLVQAASNPVVVVSVLVTLWNTINDPTTAGLGDSKNAMHYKTPKKS